jgi:hypothetical protein
VDQENIDLYIFFNYYVKSAEEKEYDKNFEFYNVTLNLVVKRKQKQEQLKSKKIKPDSNT